MARSTTDRVTTRSAGKNALAEKARGSQENTPLEAFLRLMDSKMEAARHAPDRIVTILSLDPSQVARMFRVSSIRVNRWRSGSIGPEDLAHLSMADAALDRLLAMFRPERLAQVIRWEADLFEGQTALDWILEGRITEVADRYDMALTFQA